MKLIEYILKIGFGYALSFVLLFSIVPLLYQTAINKDSQHTTPQNIQSLKIYKPSPHYDYFYLQITTDKGEAYFKNFEGDAKERKPLFQFLRKNKFLKKEEQLQDILPFELKKEQWNAINPIYFQVDGQKITELSINKTIIIGTSHSYGRKVFLIFLTIIFALAGIFGVLLMTLAFFNSYKSYQKTGTWLDLPNSIDSKTYGLKWILNGFKTPQ
ncbi:hypothetical protein NBT05_06350 [Aquimarina sp. ERC-38]|uniref:hypothetical protein n=1 Tax=Aquimarina sp. ERC-38 TaxID=2949996 RepID=UPI002246EB39|nr:hypothetical protein [Aquimarina sp. ERC-38]UZO82089.1 hypothetical protein NBT05_06350 [Aquimarina sp. ERC-38]